jgi:hypothetical protein
MLIRFELRIMKPMHEKNAELGLAECEQRRIDTRM